MVKNPSKMLSNLGQACTVLHKHYIANFKKPWRNQSGGITLKFKREHFGHTVGLVFTVAWEDLFLMYNLNCLDASLNRCFTL